MNRASTASFYPWQRSIDNLSGENHMKRRERKITIYFSHFNVFSHDIQSSLSLFCRDSISLFIMSTDEDQIKITDIKKGSNYFGTKKLLICNFTGILRMRGQINANAAMRANWRAADHDTTKLTATKCVTVEMGETFSSNLSTIHSACHCTCS